MKRGRVALAAAFFAVAIGLTLFLRSRFGTHLDLDRLRLHTLELLDYADRHYAAAIGLYFLLYVAISVAAFFPAAIALNLAAGAAFGLAVGSLLVATASGLAATLVFLVVRYAFRESFQARYRAELEVFNRHLARDGAFYVWLVRVTPVFPFAMVNIVMALTPVPALTFFLVSTLGMIPASLAYAYLGSQLATMTQLQDLLTWPVVLAFSALGILPLATRAWLRRRPVSP